MLAIPDQAVLAVQGIPKLFKGIDDVLRMIHFMDVFVKLERMTVQLHIGEDAGSTDKGYFRLFEEGEKENDLNKIYDFINGLERGNLLWPQKQIADYFVDAWEQDKKRTVEILNKKDRIIECVFLVCSICDEKRLQLVKHSDIRNSRLKLELIRQLLNERAELTDANMEAIAQGIVQLAQQDKNYFAFMIKKLEHNKSFYPAMGKALNDLSEESLKVYANAIHMDRYNHKLASVNRMLEEIRDDRQDYVLGNLQEKICARWEDFLATWLGNEENFNDIIINSYANLILVCMIKKYEDAESLIKDLDMALDIFENHLFAWYSSHTRAMSVYFIDITRLYMIKLVLVNRKTSWENREELRNRLQRVFIEAKGYAGYWKYASSKADDILGLEDLSCDLI